VAQREDQRPETVPFAWASLTDVGLHRTENQDAVQADPEIGLFLVSDGMGGAQAGALAARAVSEVLPAMLRARLSTPRVRRPRAIRYWLRREVMRLSRQLWQESAERADLKGMGATLALALVGRDRVHVAHMGDSRIYLFRGGHLERQTEDHSVVGILLRGGKITEVEARGHPARGQLSRHVGMEAAVAPDVASWELQPHDRLLLCSDGLHGMIEDDGIEEMLSREQPPDVICRLLVDAAKQAGGADNVSVVVVDWVGE